MDKFLKTYNLPTLTDEERENMNKPITRKTESIIKNFPKYKCPVLDSFTGEFYQKFKEELISILLKLFQKIEQEGIPPYSSYEVSVTLIPKPAKDTTSKENYGPISLMNTECKNLQQNIGKLNSTIQ